MTEEQMPSASEKGKDSRLRVSHAGPLELMPGVTVECAIVNGERGFIQRQLVQSIGFQGGDRNARFSRFCDKIGVNQLKRNDKSECPVLDVVMPNGGVAQWTSWEVLPPVLRAGARAYYQGRLTKQQHHIGERCAELSDVLTGIGLVSLIDEATGYQYQRAPDALQDLFSKLIRQTAADWERRFHPDYYNAVCGLFGISYGNQHRSLPPIIGKITMDWVYQVIFPPEIIAEIKSRQKSETLHQWLTKEGGLGLLEKQRDAVMMIARSSVDYQDFASRCSVAFYKPGQQVAMVYPQ